MSFSLNLVVFVFGLLAVSLSDAGVSDEDRNKIHTALIPIIAECSKAHEITEDEIKEAKAAGKLDTIDSCVLACLFKKIEIIDGKGLFDTDKVETLVKKYISNEDDQKKLIEITERCKTVNDESVSDAEEGCQRAKLIVDCSMLLKNEFFSSRR